MNDMLADYRAKRNPAQTDEPIGGTSREGAPRFAAGLERGHVKVRLHGEKLTGGHVFQHTTMRGDEQAWLMVKLDDEGADRRRKPATSQPVSVVSGKRNEDL